MLEFSLWCDYTLVQKTPKLDRNYNIILLVIKWRGRVALQRRFLVILSQGNSINPDVTHHRTVTYIVFLYNRRLPLVEIKQRNVLFV